MLEKTDTLESVAGNRLTNRATEVKAEEPVQGEKAAGEAAAAGMFGGAETTLDEVEAAPKSAKSKVQEGSAGGNGGYDGFTPPAVPDDGNGPART